MPAGAMRRPAGRAAGGSTRLRRAVRALTPTVIKLGGELLETATCLRSLARVLADVASREPLVVVHGGGREVDAEMARDILWRIIASAREAQGGRQPGWPDPPPRGLAGGKDKLR